MFVQMTYGLSPFWEVRGHLAESRKWCDVELTLAPRLPPAMEARAWLHDGSLACHIGEYERTKTSATRALGLFREVGDRFHEGRCLHLESIGA